MRSRSRQPFRSSEVEENFWPSFTDMISTIAIILFFLILIIFIKNIIIGTEFELAQDKLLSTEQALLIKADEMATLNAEISESEQNLMLLEDEADSLRLEVEEGSIALKLSEEQIIDQQIIIAMSNKELGDMRSKIQSIAVIRLTILETVKNAIETELKNTDIADDGSQVKIGDNGNIILNNTLVFKSNSSTVADDGKVLLDELALVFEKILDDDDIRDYIDAIQIEGHTDVINTSEYNRDLSAKRAISVVNHLLSSHPQLEEKYASYFVASAYSEYRPLVEGTSEAALAENRRIEISIILKDSNIQKIIDEYLEDSSQHFN